MAPRLLPVDVAPVRVGVIGGDIASGIYLKAGQVFDILDIVACADFDLDRARARAKEFGIPKACGVDELLRDESIEIVVNLSPPQARAEVAMAAIEAGKSVYNERPLAMEKEEGLRLLEEARRRNVRLGCGPDTFLGAGIQTCRKLIDERWIGKPVAATAFMMSPGRECRHPAPESCDVPWGGPMFDMGPYYLTALVALLGPARRVTGSAATPFNERVIASRPKPGKFFKGSTPTHVTGIVDFAGGAVATVVSSFDAWSPSLPRIEIYGTEGALSVPDPAAFGGPVLFRRAGAEKWSEVPLLFPYAHNSRGIGVADMAYALRSGRRHRAHGELAYHVLEIMQAFYESSERGIHVRLESTCVRPQPLSMGLVEGYLDP